MLDMMHFVFRALSSNLLQVANTYYTNACSCIVHTISMTVQLIVNQLPVHSFPIPLFDWSIKTERFSMDIFGQNSGVSTQISHFSITMFQLTPSALGIPEYPSDVPLGG